MDANTILQLQQLHRLLLRQQGESQSKPEQGVQFDRKLLDFDYGSDEEDAPRNPSPKNIITNASSALESVGR